MDKVSFDSLCLIAELIEQNCAPAPMVRETTEFWHGAAFEVLGTRCVASMTEARKVVDLSPTIPIPGVKTWVRGIANIGGRVLSITDLSAFLSGGTRISQGRQALVISGRGINTALIIDESFGGMRFPADELREGASVPAALQPYVNGVFMGETGENYAVFSIERLLRDTDFMQAGVVTTD